MVTDEWGTVLNRPHTYLSIAAALETENSGVLIAWTEEEGTQFDILFTLRPLQQGPVQRGLRGSTDLFVSIMGIGAHGFEIKERGEPMHSSYISSKYGLGGNITAEKFAELVNGVLEELAKFADAKKENN